MNFDHYSDPAEDHSGLAAWTDDEGRFFAVDSDGVAREYGDGDTARLYADMDVGPATKSRWQRFIAAIEPWYDWGDFGILRVDQEGEGDGKFFAIDFLGLHLMIVIGRTPPKSGER